MSAKKRKKVVSRAKKVTRKRPEPKKRPTAVAAPKARKKAPKRKATRKKVSRKRSLAAKRGWVTRRQNIREALSYEREERAALEETAERVAMGELPSPPRSVRQAVSDSARSSAAVVHGIHSVRIEDGALVGTDRDGNERRGYFITSNTTGETRYFWTKPHNLEGFESPEAFLDQYDIDATAYTFSFDLSDLEAA